MKIVACGSSVYPNLYCYPPKTLTKTYTGCAQADTSPTFAKLKNSKHYIDQYRTGSQTHPVDVDGRFAHFRRNCSHSSFALFRFRFVSLKTKHKSFYCRFFRSKVDSLKKSSSEEVQLIQTQCWLMVRRASSSLAKENVKTWWSCSVLSCLQATGVMLEGLHDIIISLFSKARKIMSFQSPISIFLVCLLTVHDFETFEMDLQFTVSAQ